MCKFNFVLFYSVLFFFSLSHCFSSIFSFHTYSTDFAKSYVLAIIGFFCFLFSSPFVRHISIAAISVCPLFGRWRQIKKKKRAMHLSAQRLFPLVWNGFGYLVAISIKLIACGAPLDYNNKKIIHIPFRPRWPFLINLIPSRVIIRLIQNTIWSPINDAIWINKYDRHLWYTILYKEIHMFADNSHAEHTHTQLINSKHTEQNYVWCDLMIFVAHMTRTIACLWFHVELQLNYT